MQVNAFSYDLDNKKWSVPNLPEADSPRTLVLAFGAPEVIADPSCFAQLARAYPRSIVLGCSSAGEIHGTTVKDKSVSVTTTKFDKTDLVLVSMDVSGPSESFSTGQALAKNLSAKPGLRAVLVLSEGLNVNGSELVRGLNAALGKNVVVTGGLSGDGTRFKQTWVAVGPKIKSNLVAAIGFYGDYVQVGHGSKGGWDKFGPERVVTKSEGNVLYELDGKPALQLYKEYLGDKAKDLPASGLLFPLSLRASSKDEKALVRTILAVDHEKNTLTFAGDIPKGYLAQLMKADFDRLIGGAGLATGMAKDTGTPVGKDSLVVAISCVGRRLVLGERTEEEVEAVLDAMPKGQTSHITGFYSYGELSPYASGSCDLHNQTMTLTVFSESALPLPKKSGVDSVRPSITAKPPPPPPPSRKPSPLDDVDLDTAKMQPITRGPETHGFQVNAFGYDIDKKKWSVPKLPDLDSPRTLVLAFGAPEVMQDAEPFAELSRAYPKSVVIGCSSAGEIHGTLIKDKSISVTAARFDKTDLVLASMDVAGPADSFKTGEAIAKKLAAKPGLRAILVLSEGLNVNGSELVRGINGAVDETVVVTGGLSGDGTRFKQTWVAIGAKVRSNVVAAVGFYGDYVQVGHGSKGGWDKFGPERMVTRSEGNVLFELDGKPALQLYKEYLGDKAKDLPSSGLLFPLSLRSSSADEKAVVRTVLAVDHEKNSLTFAGDIPKGYLAQLMKADFDRLIGGANLATAMAKETGAPVGKDSLVVAISCVGRRLVLGGRTEEEIEAVVDALPKAQKAHITGFYSYGELSPYASGSCDLHNQTMTLTVFSESPTPLPKRAAPAKKEVAARPPPLHRPVSPIEESDSEPVNTKMIAGKHAGFNVNAFSYDLTTKKWSVSSLPDLDSPRTLVLGFGAPEVMEDSEAFADLAKRYPKSVVIGCSSAGEIHGTTVKDKSISVTAARFEKTDLVLASMDVVGPADSFSTGESIAKKLMAKPGLRAILVLSEGLNVNGSELVRGINGVVDDSVVVTGGLSGDGTRFKQTWVAVGAKVRSNVVAAVGFYGDYVQVGHGSKGGWDKFGPERAVTKSEGNVLFELDGKPALALYKEYLGDKAKDLPSSGLLFPLSLRSSSTDDKALVRTLLAVDHDKNSLTFAGDIPKGYLAQLMKADFDRLIGGASLATAMAKETGTPIGKDSLVVAISCVGRRLVLGDRIEEEVEAVQETLPKEHKGTITGFYSYGELSPYASGSCDLHNQTMTLTVFSESPKPLPKRASVAKTAPSTTATAPSAPPPLPVPSAPPPRNVPAAAKATGSFKVRTGPVTRMTATGSSSVGANVQKTKMGDVTLVTITGRLTESFKGEALGRELRGTVAFDLAGIDRITSFGVREWLSMLGAMQDARRSFLLRASEAVANQLSMIRKFAGNAQIVSFFAPYLCSGCGDAFERIFDCERDADAIRDGNAEDTTCPNCGAMGHFDDDARSYFAFATPHLGTGIPTEIRAIADELDAATDSAAREAVDKTIENDVTRVRVQSKVGSTVRWKRVLDGIEGALAIDLGGVSGLDNSGIANFEQAVHALGHEVTSVTLERCPAAIVERFAQAGAPNRVTVSSAMLDARCQACAVPRMAHVSLHEHGDAITSGQTPRVNCKRCNGELTLENATGQATRALTLLRMQSMPKHGGPIPSSPMSMPPSSTWPQHYGSMPPSSELPAASLGGMAVQSTPASHTTSGGTLVAQHPMPQKPKRSPAFFAIGGLSLAVAALAALQLVKGSPPPAPAKSADAPVSASAAPPPASGAWMQSVDLPPAWVERPFVLDGSDVYVVGKGELAATPEAAMASARNEAIVRLVKQINQELVGSPAGDFLQARVHEVDKSANEAIANRYIKQFGATASPDRVDAAIRKRESGVEGFARYKMSKTAYQSVVSGYRDTTTLQGMTVARFFPLLETTMHTEGDLVVLSVARGRPAIDLGVRAGDIVLAVGTHPVATTEALNKTSNEEWATTPVRGRMSVEIESAGAKRSISFFKPEPPRATGNGAAPPAP